MTEIASTNKITYHKNKLDAFLRNEPIFPATLELDLTSVCNRNCADCPSTAALPSQRLSTDFVERLLSRLEGQTRGLLLTGGEPTMADNFAEVLAMARRHSFRDVVIVSNGSFLNEEHVAKALLEHASAVRISLYDWSTKSCGGLVPTLQRIEKLKTRIEREGSALEIGVSALTRRENVAALGTVARQAASAGANWIYFHPTCTQWELGTPTLENQDGVLDQIAQCQASQPDGFKVHVFNERYRDQRVEFHGYHASHFLLVIGADGLNYLGAEVKYQPQHVVADVAREWHDDFLWRRERLERIASVQADSFPALGSLHRGILYSDMIEQFLHGVPAPSTPGEFRFPHIL